MIQKKGNGRQDTTHWIKGHTQFIVLPFVIIAIMLGVFAVKGVYPFGETRVTYYDMTQDNVPACTYLWDIQHGKANVLFDWNSGAGISWVASICKFLFRPSNLFFYFVERDAIWEAMSFYVILNMVLAALSICFYLYKAYPRLDAKWQVTVPLLYVFSGYLLQYYTNIFFLDFMILMPLMHLALVIMLEKGKSRWYILCLSYSLVLDIYFSFMMCLYLILISFFYLVLRMDKEHRSAAVGRLIRSTFVCFVCTAWSTIPTAIQMMESIRSGYGDSLYITMTMSFYSQYRDEKVYMLIGCEMLAAVVIISLIKKKWSEQRFWYHILVIAAFILPIAFESVNLVWHIGSYISFPYRCAFMLSFGMVDFFAWFLADRKEITFLRHGRIVHLASYPIYVLGLILSGLSVWKYAECFINNGIYYSEHENKEPMQYFIAAFLILSLFWCYILLQEKTRSYLFCILLILLQASLLSYGYFAPLHPNEAGEEIVVDSLSVKELADDRPDSLSRIKGYTCRISQNYPSLLGIPSLSNRSYNLKQGYVDALKELGYTNDGYMAYDGGGTLFADALLNVKQTFSGYEIDQKAYRLRGAGEEFYLYDNAYAFPIGTVFSEKICNQDTSQWEGIFAYQNLLAECMGQEEALFEITELPQYLTKTVKDLPMVDYYIRIPVTGSKILYLESVDQVKGVIRVNGKKIYADSFVSKAGTVFPVKKSNGLLCLGSFEDAVVTIQIHTSARSVKSFRIGQLSYDSLQSLADEVSSHAATDIVAEGTRFSCNLNSDRDGFFLVPLQYQNGWSATVNGKKTEIVPIIRGGFIGIPVTEGENRIEMHFLPSGLAGGLCVSVVSAVIAAFLYWLNGRKKITDKLPKVIVKAGDILYYTVVTAAIILVFLYPIFLEVI